MELHKGFRSKQGLEDRTKHKSMRNKGSKIQSRIQQPIHDMFHDMFGVNHLVTDLSRRSDPAEASLSLRAFADSRLRDVGDAACPPMYPCPPLGEYGEERNGPMREEGE
jgi:hypothetical protein